jgi:RNA polymerase sigma-70 factor (ECF subfamily)
VTRAFCCASKGLLALAILDKAKAVGFDEDVVLIERYLAGDEAAFERLYAKYYDKVYALARGVLFDAEEAADTVQEIFTLVYRHLNRFDRRARFSTWLFRVAVNRSIQQARRLKVRPRQAELTEGLAESVDESPSYVDPKIDAAMSRLHPSDRAALVLFYWEELSLNEIAESLGCSVNAAKTRLYRARERFRAVYEQEADA